MFRSDYFNLNSAMRSTIKKKNNPTRFWDISRIGKNLKEEWEYDQVAVVWTALRDEKSFNSENCDKTSDLKLFTTSYMFPCNFNNDSLHNVWRQEMCDKLLTVYSFKWRRKFRGLYALDFKVPWNCLLQYLTWPTLFSDLCGSVILFKTKQWTLRYVLRM